MTAVEHHLDKTEAARLFEWRFERLMHAGYLPDQAKALASEHDVDVRLAEQLLARGCPRATAVRILR